MGVAASLSAVLNNGLVSRFVPASGDDAPRPRLMRNVMEALRAAPEAAIPTFEHGVAAAVALEQLAHVVGPSLQDERLRLPEVSDLEGGLEEERSLQPGSLLLSNPADGPPGREVLIVLGAESKDEAKGTAEYKALCVNRPLPGTVVDVLPEVSLGPLGSNFVFHGGEDDPGAVFLLHRHPALPGATTLSADGGVAAGAGLVDLAAVIADGVALPSDFKVVRGCTRVVYDGVADDFPSHPGALLATGAAVGGLTLAPALFEGSSKHRGDAAPFYEHDKFFHQDTIWKEAMRLLGGACAVAGEMHPAAAAVARAALSVQDQAEEGGA